jgi:hypothetical protein
MKEFILSIFIILSTIIAARTQKANDFNVDKFQQEIMKQMYKSFTLNCI